jgi:signal transduction histidine kinase
MPLHALGFWIAHAAYWAVASAANVLLSVAFRVPDPLAFNIAECGLCFVATAAMRQASHRQAFLEWAGLSKIGVIAGGALISAVLVQAVLLAAGRFFGVEVPPRPEIVARFLITLTMIVNWCAFYFGYQLVRDHNSTEVRALRAESEALRNELKHLQAQISPHFLFNALNTVQACRDDPDAITALTQALAAYLRFLIQPAAPLEPLSRELDALENYLTILEVRFGDGLETRIDCDFDVRGVPVPAVMVQPLAENAIKYGGQTGPRPIRVHVTARREGEWLAIEVANTGRWVAPGGGQSTGTGLHSLERRLQLLAGPACTVSHCEEDGWVRVMIRIPAPGAPIDQVAETMRGGTA